MITGLPPNQDPDEFFASKNNPMKKFASKMKKRMSGGKAKSSRSKIYRQRADLPLDINEVISQLTHYDVTRRCTVRNAMNMPWIKNCEVGENTTEEYPCMKTGSPITYLSSSITNTATADTIDVSQ